MRTFSYLTMAFLAAPVSAVPRGHVIGLAEVPLLVSSETGADQPGGRLKLYASPDPKAKVVATLPDWVNLETESFEDVPRALVFEARKDWLLVRASAVSGWVAPRDHGKVANVFDALKSAEGYLAKDWDQKIWSDPEKPTTVEIYPRPEPKELSIAVIAERSIHGVPWLQIKIIRGTCGDLPEVETLKTGWVPAYKSPTGDLNAWYYSGGC